MCCVIIALHRALKRWRASRTIATDTGNQNRGVGTHLAMDKVPGPACLSLKFSSANFSP